MNTKQFFMKHAPTDPNTRRQFQADVVSMLKAFREQELRAIRDDGFENVDEMSEVLKQRVPIR